MIILLAPHHAHHSLIYVYGISCRLISSTTPSAFYQYVSPPLPTIIMISDYYQYSCHLSLFWLRVNTIEPWCHFWTPHNFLHIELLTTYHAASENKRKFLTNSGLPQPNLFFSASVVSLKTHSRCECLVDIKMFTSRNKHGLL